MEEEYRAYEAATFSNVAETEKQDQLFNNTPPDTQVAMPAYSSMLFNNKPGYNDQTVGPALSLQVDRGDKLTLETFAQFEGYNGDGSKIAGNTLIGAIAGVFTPLGATAEVAQNILDQFANAGVGAPLAAKDNGFYKVEIDNGFCTTLMVEFEVISENVNVGLNHESYVEICSYSNETLALISDTELNNIKWYFSEPNSNLFSEIGNSDIITPQSSGDYFASYNTELCTYASDTI